MMEAGTFLFAVRFLQYFMARASENYKDKLSLRILPCFVLESYRCKVTCQYTFVTCKNVLEFMALVCRKSFMLLLHFCINKSLLVG
jgi:hypothetical protein